MSPLLAPILAYAAITLTTTGVIITAGILLHIADTPPVRKTARKTATWFTTPHNMKDNTK